MPQDERITKIINEATEGLRDDEELRLDVKAELASHIDDKVESFKSEGKSEEESVEIALTSFGNASDIATELTRANIRRMKIRSIARLLIRAVLVPLAVAIVLILSVNHCIRLRGTLAFLVSAGAEPQSMIARLNDVLPGTRTPAIADPLLNAQHAFLFEGDPTRGTKAAQQRAIWEADTDSMVYFGNYISCLLSENSDPSLLEEELRLGEILEPDNARYTYALAEILLKRACQTELSSVRNDNGEKKNQTELIINDRNLLDRAMTTFSVALSKPYYKTYASDMLCEQFALLPRPRHFDQHLAQMTFLSSVLHPDIFANRELARAAPEYARLLIHEGRFEEARVFLNAWLPLSLHVLNSSFSIIEVLIASTIAQSGHNSALIYEEVGMQTTATAVREAATRMATPINDWNDRRRERSPASWAPTSGFLQRLLTPFLNQAPTQEDLAPGRNLEYVLFEQMVLSLMLFLFLVLTCACLVISLRWQLKLHSESRPLLILPSWRTVVHVLALTVALPFVAFYLYTRWSGLAGRGFSLSHRFAPVAMEVLLLTVTILFMFAAMAKRAIRTRCTALGIAVPEPGSKRIRWLFVGALFVVWISVLIVRRSEVGRVYLLIVGSTLSIAFLICACLALLKHLAAHPSYGRFHGTLARSAIPFLCAAMIVAALLCQPYLSHQEAAFLNNDPFLRLPHEEKVFTWWETDIVRSLKKKMLSTAASIMQKGPFHNIDETAPDEVPVK